MAKKSIPVIDMQDVSTLPEKIVKSCEEWGGFRLINHGISMELMSEMKTVTRAMFDIPREIREKSNSDIEDNNCAVPPNLYASTNYEGMCLPDVTMPGAVDHFCDLLHASSHQREIISNYVNAITDVAHFIGSKLMEGLGLESDLLKEWECRMNMNKYNFSPETVGLTGGFMHSDIGFLAVLQDDELVSGLEVVDKITGELVSVDPMPGGLVINVGDIAMVWSNGKLHSVKHRVQCYNPTVRISTVLHVLAPKNEKIEAPPQLVDSGHPRLYVPFYFKDYRKQRIAANPANARALDELFRAKN